jgi:rhodanese-related sulfurtransferase
MVELGLGIQKNRNMIRLVIGLLIVLSPFGVQAQTLTKINNEELVALMENTAIELIDVRTPNEVSKGRIAGAVNIDFYDKAFSAKISELDKQKPIVVYCAAGGRSANAGNRLKKLGFTKIYDLTGGFNNWHKQKFPVDK